MHKIVSPADVIDGHRRVGSKHVASGRAMMLPKRRLAELLERAGVRLTQSLRRDISDLSDRLEKFQQMTLDALRSTQEDYRKALSGAFRYEPVKMGNPDLEVYGAPPTLRRIPGWHTGLGVDESEKDWTRAGRLDLWSHLQKPVLMRWFADLLVMIWPGNELSRVLFLTGQFEPNELSWMSGTLKKDMTVVDIGAHIGLYSMIAAKLVGESGLVLAIEPSIREFQRLTFHMVLNSLTNVRCLNVAITDAERQSTLRVASDFHSGHNTLGDFISPSVEILRDETVRTQSLDVLVAAQRLERVDVVKIDIEGAELKALTGASETLKRFRPRLLVEVSDATLRRQGTSAAEVCRLLEEQDYMLHEFSPITGEVTPVSAFGTDYNGNVVALPR